MLTDPPYHLTNEREGTRGFMGQAWDGGSLAHNPQTWKLLAQHLLPGAFGMTFGSARGWHRLACAIEDAGLILHPSVFMLGWSNGNGFPKATRIDTQIDAAAGAAREVIAQGPYASKRPHVNQATQGLVYADDSYLRPSGDPLTAPATPLAAAWAGHRYGLQVLKPAIEPILVWQKPYAGRPVDSITATGAGALWVEGSRVALENARPLLDAYRKTGAINGGGGTISGGSKAIGETMLGRWPPNLCLLHTPECQPVGTRQVHGTHHPGPHAGRNQAGTYGGYVGRHQVQDYAAPDGTETVTAYYCAPGCPVAALDAQAGEHKAGGPKDCRGEPHGYGEARQSTCNQVYESYGDTGAVSRFFPQFHWSDDVAAQLAVADPVLYCGKASSRERDAGTTGNNYHPTVKPLALLQWLATLLLPPPDYAPRRLLVPFAGSGSECIAAQLSGWEEVLGIEASPEYCAIAQARLAWWTGERLPGTWARAQTPSAAPEQHAQQLPLF
jgi:hypothetical protein